METCKYYREINNELRRETDKEREIQLDENPKEVKEPKKSGRSDLMHKKVMKLIDERKWF